jgi:hypothetical protein
MVASSFCTTADTNDGEAIWEAEERRKLINTSLVSYLLDAVTVILIISVKS